MNLANVIVSDASDGLPGNPETARQSLSEAVLDSNASEAPAAPAQPTEADPDADIPEKFRGKTPKDIVEMYRNLESRMGAMANDLGQQRALTDRLLDLKRGDDLQRNTPPGQKVEAPKVSANDLLDRPQETLERVLDHRDARVATNVDQRLAQLEGRIAQTSFVARHPDFKDVVSDQGFRSWVESSPIRLRAAAAANSGDWVIADDLLSEFKATRGASPAATAAGAIAPAQTADLEGARKGSLETRGNAGAAPGSKSGKKQYSRVDLMRLRITDPEAYYDESFQEEILRAHHEGRVK